MKKALAIILSLSLLAPAAQAGGLLKKIIIIGGVAYAANALAKNYQQNQQINPQYNQYNQQNIQPQYNQYGQQINQYGQPVYQNQGYQNYQQNQPQNYQSYQAPNQYYPGVRY